MICSKWQTFLLMTARRIGSEPADSVTWLATDLADNDKACMCHF